MNGVALVFLLTALGAALPDAGESRWEPAVLPRPAPMESVPVSVDLEGAATRPAEPSPAAHLEAGPARADLTHPPETPVYREMPDLVDPVPVLEPVPRPRPSFPAARAASTASKAEPEPASRLTPGAGIPAAKGTASAAATTARMEGVRPAALAGKGSPRTPQPAYPAFARRDRLQGTVVLSISVSNGAVASVRVLNSSGSAPLDQYAVSHVQRRWQWPPGTTQTFTQPLRFMLK